jgi:protein SCO1/2
MKKSNYSYIGISFIILLFGIIFIPKIINRINNDEIVDGDRHNLVRKAIENQSTLADSLMIIGQVPNFRFTNQTGETITNESYRGKVYVAEFFFTTCPSICPVMNRNMVKVQNKFKGNENVGIASFSIDPAYDTPEVLLEYAQNYKISNPNWHLLTGDKDEIFKLANEGFNLYVGEAPEVEGGFEHSGFFALIDQNGNIRSRFDENDNPIIYYDGLEDEGIRMLMEDISLLLKK